jgi:hypothetical protein
VLCDCCAAVHVSPFPQTPELLADIEVPESVSILGQTVDLSQVRGLLQPVSQGISGIISQASHIGWGSGQGGGGDWVLEGAMACGVRQRIQGVEPGLRIWGKGGAGQNGVRLGPGM